MRPWDYDDIDFVLSVADDPLMPLISVGLRRHQSCFNAAVTPTPDEDETDARRRAIDEQLLILDAIESALDRRREVMDLLDTSVDMDDARLKLGQLWQVDDLGTQAVLDLQLRRLPIREREKIAERRAQLLDQREALH